MGLSVGRSLRFLRLILTTLVLGVALPLLSGPRPGRTASAEEAVPPRPRAAGGLLDLRAWDFKRDGAVSLSGTWVFFPGRLLAPEDAAAATGGQLRSIPDFWKGNDAGERAGRGAGTYRLKILFAETAGDLALRYKTVSTAFRLFANGTEIAHAGSPAVQASEARAGYAPGVVRLPAASEIDLTVWVSNHEYRTGGMWRAFIIGDQESVVGAKRRSDLLSFALGGFILAIALSRFSFFVFRKKELSSLFLCLFALVIAFRILVTGEYSITEVFPEIGFDLLIRLEYVTAFLAVPTAGLFFASFFPDESSPLLRVFLSLPSLAFLLLVPFSPLPLLTRTISVYYPVALLSIAAVLVLILVPAVVHRRRGSWAMLAGSVIIGSAAVNDMLYSSFVVTTGNLLPLGLTLFVGFQALVLARRFTTAFSEVETLSTELTAANGSLEHEIAQSVVVQKQLEMTVAEKELLLREVHHRVKNSLQIVSSIVALQAHRATEPAALEAYGEVRDRLRAVSMVHEKLYSLASGELIDFGDYAKDLVEQLAATYGSESEDVDLSIGVERVDAPMDFCIDAGLLLTELVSNAYKHAIIPRGGGSIRVVVRREGTRVELRVEDDGPGFPADFAPDRAASLGFRITNTLVRKRGGRYFFGAAGDASGARVDVSLPLAET